MAKKTMNLVKGIGMGVAAGAAVAAVGTKLMNGKPGAQMKKTAGKTLHNIGEMLDDMGRMLK